MLLAFPSFPVRLWRLQNTKKHPPETSTWNIHLKHPTKHPTLKLLWQDAWRPSSPQGLPTLPLLSVSSSPPDQLLPTNQQMSARNLRDSLLAKVSDPDMEAHGQGVERYWKMKFVSSSASKACLAISCKQTCVWSCVRMRGKNKQTNKQSINQSNKQTNNVSNFDTSISSSYNVYIYIYIHTYTLLYNIFSHWMFSSQCLARVLWSSFKQAFRNRQVGVAHQPWPTKPSSWSSTSSGTGCGWTPWWAGQNII